jgi:arsenate reductase
MAEAYLNKLGGDNFEAQSAGIEPGKLNPAVVRVLKEDGIDISQNKTKSVQEFLVKKIQFDYVITVCDETSAERCPSFPGKGQRLHWGFPDPSAFKGSDEEKLIYTRPIRDAIKIKIQEFLSSFQQNIPLA